MPLASDSEGPRAARAPRGPVAGLTAPAHQSSGALPTHAIGRPSLVRPQCGSSIESRDRVQDFAEGFTSWGQRHGIEVL
ncbi:hypothetical protein ACOBQB_00375 [Streptomyces sp. G5(2025)]|uniref:hypothetical protein n=1 Tax=Streptomyces sp. G5(2025) TaxID=3406628 RepID=UPI003C171D5C